MKKSRLYFLIAVTSFTITASAQDKIYKSDNSVIEAKVLEVGMDQIKYRSFSNLDGPIYTMPKSEIAIIIYQNGQHETFSKNNKALSGQERSTSTFVYDSLKNSVISVNLVDVIFSNFTFSYEHFNNSKRVGIKIPFSVGLREENAYSYGYYGYNYYRNFNDTKIYSIGLDADFYPNGQKKRFSYYLGPSFVYGEFNYVSYNYFSSSYIYSYRKGQHFGLLLNNGVVFKPSRSIAIALSTGIGFKKEITIYSDYIEPSAAVALNIGYIF
jgi:hypothetical protein